MAALYAFVDGFGSFFSRLEKGLNEFMDSMSEGMAAYRRYQGLSAMSDTALAKHGLNRGDLAREAMFPSRRSLEV
ncbi:DUF1127 domain-containing protein [Telmatospirillum sp. J64-1]|uniref:DUF1127 domain-containing protein n=1 Tax=Telmatospirillum sp. J64-1 TaxID=2502183 RepID=UPI00115F0149|nr:DUF1127 domain-containing protein [Telmatospirillum sp. J64-1]